MMLKPGPASPATSSPRKKPRAFQGLAGSPLARPVGRPPKNGAAMTSVERQKDYRRRSKEQTSWAETWAELQSWMPFDVLETAEYLALNAGDSGVCSLTSFNFDKAVVITGVELKSELQSHSREFPDPDGELSAGKVMLSGIPALALPYKDHVRYIIPNIRQKKTVYEVLTAAGIWYLNMSRGTYLRQAPHGLGELISGWGLEKSEVSYGVNSEGEELDDGLTRVSDKYEALVQTDDAEQVYRQADTEWKCKLCGAALDAFDLANAAEHFRVRHKEEFRQLLEEADKTRKRQAKQGQIEKSKQRRKQRRKQRSCKEDHARMAESMAVKGVSRPFYCESCGKPL
jgi:hypothetical protein